MTTYYTDSQNGDDVQDGLSEVAAWQTEEKVNAQPKQSGDEFLFKWDSVFRGTLEPNVSAADGTHILYGDYGVGTNKPLFKGSDLIAGWTDGPTSNSWGADLITKPNQVFFDGVLGLQKPNKASLAAEGNWYWDDTEDGLYVYAIDDPDNLGWVIEASVRSHGILMGFNSSYIVLRNLDAQHANASVKDGGAGIRLRWGSKFCLLNGCEASWNFGIGINVSDPDPSKGERNVVEQAVTHDNHEGGLRAALNGTTFRECESFRNRGKFGSGIKFFDESESGGQLLGGLAEGCDCYENEGTNIHVDGHILNEGYINGIIIRDNKAHLGLKNGINMEMTEDCEAYRNECWANAYNGLTIDHGGKHLRTYENNLHDNGEHGLIIGRAIPGTWQDYVWQDIVSKDDIAVNNPLGDHVLNIEGFNDP